MKTLTEILGDIAKRITALILGLLGICLWTTAYAGASLRAGAAQAAAGPQATHEAADETDVETERVLALGRAFSMRARNSEARHDPEAGRPVAPVMVAEVDMDEELTPEGLPRCR